VPQVLAVRLTLVLGWLAELADGYVAGCTWHVHIVSTSDADKHNPRVVHNAMPGAPPMDVTDDISNLTVTGIKMDDDKVTVNVY